MMVSSGSVPEILSPNIAKKNLEVNWSIALSQHFVGGFVVKLTSKGSVGIFQIFLVNEAISVGIHHTEGFFEFLDL